MRRTITILKTIGLTTALAVVMSFNTVAQQLHLQFENVVNGKPVALDTATYENALGQSYTVSNLKYYISNIQLHSTAGQILADSGYYLIREDEPASMGITLKHVPEGIYNKIIFTIGVDSLHNCSGAQSDALDPVNGMFWTWNTGYIFFKLEGKSNASKNPGGVYEYHIGGYKAPAVCMRTVSIEIGKGRLPDVPELPESKAGRKEQAIQTLHIHADVAKLMNEPQPLDIARYNSITDFHNAGLIADRYQHIFSLGYAVYVH